MIDELRTMAIFAEVIKFGSFRAAAKSLNLSPSVVSYHISQLEEKLGAALIYRSTRKLSLTDKGQVFYHHVLDMLASAQMGLNQIADSKTGLSGKIKITMPTALLNSPFSQKLVNFSQENPNVTLDLTYTDEQENLIANGIDLAIRAGEMPDSALKSKRIGEIERVLVCSPEYYAKHPTPIAPQNLVYWTWVKLSMLKNQRLFTHPKFNAVEVKYQHQISVNSVTVMTQLALMHAGLATPARYSVGTLISQQKLVHVLPDWSLTSIPLYAVWPANATSETLSMQVIKLFTPT